MAAGPRLDVLVCAVWQTIGAQRSLASGQSETRPGSAAPYVLLMVALVGDGLLKQILNFSQLSYVPLVAAILIFVAWGLSRPVQSRPTASVLVVVGLLLAWSVAELYNPLGAFRTGAGPVAFERYLPLVCLWLAPNLLAHKADLRTLFRVLSTLALVSAVFGIYEYLVGPGAVTGWGPGFDPYRAGFPWYSAATQSMVLRPDSTFSAPALAAEFCLVSLVGSGWLLFDSSRAWRILAAASIAGSGVFIAICGTRVVMIQLIIFVIALGILTMRSLRILVPALIAGIVLLAVYALVPAVSERMGGVSDLQAAYAQEYASPGEVFNLISARPLGSGIGTSWDVTGSTANIENYYAVVASDLGFPGPILMVLLIGIVALWSFREFRRSTDAMSRFLTAGVGVYSLTLFLVMVTGLGLDKPTVAWVYWTLAGLMVATPALRLEGWEAHART
jgi:hypothetical protein